MFISLFLLLLKFLSSPLFFHHYKQFERRKKEFYFFFLHSKRSESFSENRFLTPKRKPNSTIFAPLSHHRNKLLFIPSTLFLLTCSLLLLLLSVCNCNPLGHKVQANQQLKSTVCPPFSSSAVPSTDMSTEFWRGLQAFRDMAREVNNNVCSFWRVSQRTPPPKDVDLRGQSFVVTGGNRGFGKGVTLELASRGANVIIGARGSEAAKAVIAEAAKLYPESPPVQYFPLDLTSFDSIRAFSRQVKESLGANQSLSGLVNNATLWMGTQTWTPARDGQPEMEPTWAVNIFGLAYLTRQLEELLLKSNDARIVNVSSLGHLMVPFVDTCDPMARNRPSTLR